MWKREQWRAFFDLPVVEWSMFILGILLLALSVVVGSIPGPGGLIFGIPGLILILKSSMWARRYYVKLKRWEGKKAPKVLGRRVTPTRWADLILRRRSALRREAIRKEQEAAGEPDQIADQR